MKIGQLGQHCGNCSIMEYCAEPFDDLCLCAREDLENIKESEYIKMAKEIQSRNKRISNKKMADRICKGVRKGGFGMYKVPMDMPEFCNKCPFGMLDYSFPFGSSSISRIDGKEDKAGTYGYVCNIEFQKNEKHTKVLRAEWGEDIKKPKWCELKKG